MKRLICGFLAFAVMLGSVVSSALASENTSLEYEIFEPQIIQSQEDAAPDTVLVEADEPIGAVRPRTFSLMTASAAAPETVDGVYQLDSAEDLIWFSEQVNTGVGALYDAVLLNDIDMTGITEWTPIGAVYPYSGTFDGAGYSILNFAISATDTQFIGLFGKVTGTIKSLTMDESCAVTVNVTDAFEGNIWLTGMICVTYAGSVIENCHNEADYTVNAAGATATGSITAYVGTVLGQHSGTATNCSNSADVTYITMGGAAYTGSAFVGGVIARNYNGEAVVSCVNEGEIVTNISSGGKSLTVYAGGVAGGNSGLTSNCSNFGAIRTSVVNAGGVSAYTGGVFGYNSSNCVKECVNEGSVALAGERIDDAKNTSITNFYVGGITGYDVSSTLTDCENRATVSANIPHEYDEKLVISLGGIVGRKSGGAIKGCLNLAEVTGNIAIGSASWGARKTGVVTPVCAGGIAGDIEEATVEQCRQEAAVSLKLSNSTSGSLGGVVGLNYSGSVIKCENNGDVYGEAADATFYAGGVVGDSYTAGRINGKGANIEFPAVVDSVCNAGTVTVSGGGTVGGVVGNNYTYSFDATRRYAYIINSKNIASVTAPNASVGGVTGNNRGFIYNSYNNADLTGKKVGGITAGYGYDNDPKIINCYSVGTIDATSDKYFITATGRTDVVSYCYWFDALEEAAPTHFSNCDSFGEARLVRYEGGEKDVSLLEALNRQAEAHSDATSVWRSWKMGDDGYPELGDLIPGTESEAQYQAVDGGEWITSSFNCALADVYDGGIVKLLRNVEVTDFSIITKDVTITGATEGELPIITNSAEAHNSLLRIRSGDVTFENIILDGGYVDESSGVSSMEALVVIEGFSTLTIESGAELRNNYNRGYSQDTLLSKLGGAINAFEKSTVVLNGGKIYNNSNCHGAVILNNGAHFILNDGVLQNNTSAAGFGGAVYIYNGSFTMNDGSLEGNTAAGEGGAVYMVKGTITMNGGSIKENTAKRNGGGGIYIQAGTFTMNGGSITNNDAPAGHGGGIFLIQAGITLSGSNPTGPVATNSFAYLNNGIISGNNANIGGGIAVNSSSNRYWNGEGTWGEMKLSNVTITDNTAASRSGGMEMTPGNVVHLSDYVYIAGNICETAPNLSDVVLRNTDDEYVNETGIFIIDSALDDGSAICMDTLFKAAEPSDVKALVARGADSYIITKSDYDKFVCANSDYALLFDSDGNCIWLMQTGPVVTFDTQGGSDVAPVTVMHGKAVPKPEDPTRSGYSFVGWFTSEDEGVTLSEEPYDFEAPVEYDFTLYAKWEKKSSPGSGGGGVTPRGNVILTKVDAKDSTTTLSGVEFKLYNSSGALTGTYTTDVNGQIKVTSLHTGKYYWIESRSAEGYVLDDARHEFEIAWNKTTEITVTNRRSDIPDVFRQEHFAYINGYPDGNVKPEANITRAEVATILFRLLNDETREKYITDKNSFSDVKAEDWFNTAVSTMAEMEVIKGYPSGEFAPNANITRAEFAALAARFATDDTAIEAAGFTDTSGHWAEDEINKAVANGWVLGYEDNSFRPDNFITRAEAMTLINRVLQRIPETTDDLLDDMLVWSDNSDTAAWYYIAVQEATNSHEYERKENGREYWTSLTDALN